MDTNLISRAVDELAFEARKTQHPKDGHDASSEPPAATITPPHKTPRRSVLDALETERIKRLSLIGQPVAADASGSGETSNLSSDSPRTWRQTAKIHDIQPYLNLNLERLVIGSGPDSDIHLNHGSVQRNHALLIRKSDGFWIENLGSQSKTLVNKTPINAQQKLTDRDLVEIGKFRFLFVDGDRENLPGTQKGLIALQNEQLEETGPGDDSAPLSDQESVHADTPQITDTKQSSKPLILALLMTLAVVAIGFIASMQMGLIPAPIHTEMNLSNESTAPVRDTAVFNENASLPEDAPATANATLDPSVDNTLLQIPSTPSVGGASALSPDTSATAGETESTNTAFTPSNPVREQHSDDAYRLFVQALVLQTHGQIDESLQLLDQGLQKDADDVGLLALQEQLLLIQQRQSKTQHEQHEEIGRLLDKADKLRAKRYLTIPKDNNAFDNYQQVLKLDPNNQPAQAGLRRIADAYLQLSQADKARGELLKSMQYVKRGLMVDPTHSGLIAMRWALIEEVPAIGKSDRQWRRQQEQADRLISKVQQELQAGRKQEALKLVRAALDLLPGNPQLTAVAQKIERAIAQEKSLSRKQKRGQQEAQRFVAGLEAKARQRLQDGAIAESRSLVQTGLKIMPQHAGLQKLKARIAATDRQTP